jgi:hypothetical protein
MGITAAGGSSGTGTGSIPGKQFGLLHPSFAALGLKKFKVSLGFHIL